MKRTPTPNAAPADNDQFVILDVSDTTQGANGSTKGLVASRVARTGTANVFTAAQTVDGNLAVDTKVLFVDASNDRVGIGTASPSARLHIFGNNPTPGIYGNGVNLPDFHISGSYSQLGQIVSVNNFAGTRILTIQGTGNVGIGTDSPSAQLHVDQSSANSAKPTLHLRQADLSEEFIRFDTTVGAGNPINTTALGAYYGRVRVWVEGVGAKWLALYD